MINNLDLHMLNIAKAVSKLSDFKQTKLGCVIVYKKQILSTGYNAEKTNPYQRKYNVYCHFDEPEKAIDKVHAEIAALSKLPWFVYENHLNFRKFTVYVYREYKSTHKYACALPCSACYRALQDCHIGRIVATIKDGIKEIKLN